jgi:predicted RNA binding protein YcfA (HicA-like mRNA interferase family)
MLSSREIIKKIESDGWFKVGQVGDHVQFKHPTKTGKVTVTHPKKDFSIKMVRTIEKQTGVRLL